MLYCLLAANKLPKTKMKKGILFFTIIIIAILVTNCKSTVNDASARDRVKDEIIIQFIRNATVTVNYQNIKILIDPILADQGTEPPIPFSNLNKNPTIKLPMDKKELIKDVDAVLLTHYHSDHFDME